MPASQITIPKAVGLYVQSNSLTVPQGAFEQADNVVINQDNVIRKRRGFSLFHDASLESYLMKNLVDYLGQLFIVNADSVKTLNSSGVVTSTYTGETVELTGRTRYTQANGNLYFTTDNGVRKLESLTDTTVYKAGVPSALDLDVTFGSPLIGPIAPDCQVAYRVVFGRRDNNNNLLLGAPSELFVITNAMQEATYTNASPGGIGTITVTVSGGHGYGSSGSVFVVRSGSSQNGIDGETAVTITSSTTFTFTASENVTPASGTLQVGIYKTPELEATLPSDIYNLSVSLGTSYFYQVYRSSQTASEDVSPDEDLKLVQENRLTSTDLTNKYVTFTDEVDDIFLGSYLYTNPNTGEGILQKNDRPPSSCQDIALFKGHMFYANVVTEYTLLIDLISASSTNLGINDTIQITQGATTRTYTAKATENYTSQHFKLTNNGGPITVSEAVAATSRSLVKTINRDPSALVYAYYVSGFDDAPGKMAFISKDASAAFSVTAQTAGATTPGSAFSPTLPSSGTTIAGTNNSYTNGLYISKQNEPEAVPSTNFLLLGSRSMNILRIAPLRDSLIVITNEGVYRVNGDNVTNFQSTLIDSTVPCLAKDSVSVLNNQVYYVSTQGVVAISDTAASIISRAIDPLILAVIGKSYFEAQTYGASYESEHLYLLCTVSPQATTSDVVYCYNSINQTWVQWDTVFKDGIVRRSDDKFYYINFTNEIKQERKNQNKLDFTDESFTVTIDTVSDDLLSCTATVTGANGAVGDVIVVNSVINRIIDAQSSAGVFTYTFLQPVNFEASDTGMLFKGFTSTIKTAPQTGGDISRWKQFSEFQMSMRNQAISRVNVKFSTDSVAESDTTTWTNDVIPSGWGLFGFAQEPWGQEEGTNQVYQTKSAPVVRTYVPMNASRATYIQAIVEHSTAAEDMSIQSMSYTARAYGQRVTR